MISIIIPTYNERDNVCRLIPAILSVTHDANIQTEIVIVDDDSPDKTANEVRRRFGQDARVSVFVRKAERGLATAILYGIRQSKGDIIIGMDADFNHPPGLIPDLVHALSKHDLVVASRFIARGGMEERGRYVGTLLFNLFLKYILSFPTMDNMSGFYAIRRDMLERLNIDDIYKGYGDYHLRLLWYAKSKRYMIAEVPVFYRKRIYGKSKSHLLSLFVSYLVCAAQLRLKKN